jgi:hypothetical protein
MSTNELVVKDSHWILELESNEKVMQGYCGEYVLKTSTYHGTYRRHGFKDLKEVFEVIKGEPNNRHVVYNAYTGSVLCEFYKAGV